MTAPQALSYNLKRLRRLRGGLSQAALSELAGISLNLLGNIERQETWPSDTTITKLATALKVKETALFFDPEAEFSPEEISSLVLRMAKKQQK